MWKKVRQIFRDKDLRKRIGFVIAMLIIFRIGAHIPIPAVEATNLQSFFQSNQILGLLNIFSGGALENFSIMMLGVGPYITSSIIFQLLTYIVPRLEEMQKEEGEAGRQKINQYTRLLTVPLAIVQGYGTLTLFQRSGAGLIGAMTSAQWVAAIISITAGSLFLMWLGELISEKRVGNGISLLIFAGIIAGIPTALQQFLATFDSTQIILTATFIAIGLITIAGVVFITEGQRSIPVSYARRYRGSQGRGAMMAYLPLRVNQAGVIPIIFAVSLVLLPSIVAQFFASSSSAVVASLSNRVIEAFNNQGIYGLIYFLLVVAFTYFYTAIIFHPEQVAENLQKNGGFVPGIRPGAETARYLQFVSTRILLLGALFLGVIAVLPVAFQSFSGFQNLTIGGTSLLIVVSVAIETVKQIDAQLVMRDYEGL